MLTTCESLRNENNFHRTILFFNIDFFLLQQKTLLMTKEQASEFYAEHTGKSFFYDLINYMTSGPIKALVLTRENAIEKWRQLIGPTNVVEAKAEQPDRFINLQKSFF